ncbi:hypothetical protein [Ruminococcus sp.]|uniref:hypothetical protein n=1 Tax=Ruminococcus sp. TaxID=41978 RepID=UPI0025F6FAF2|nr:hypothetical protein [Ruminococcus sp.]MBQ8966262.1 hypothetical protein [Ruminococcus sp.]
MASTTKIVGWTRKAAFDGEINGKHITSPEKIVLHIETTEVQGHHGTAVDTLKIPLDSPLAQHGDEFLLNGLIGSYVRLDYQLFNGRPQLINIVVVDEKGTPLHDGVGKK